jgi:Mg-chelatase subunit ChlD
MKLYRAGKPLLLIGALVFLSQCDPLLVTDQVVVRGIVLDENGAPIKGVAVTVDGVEAQGLTDSKGRYVVQSPYELSSELSITALRPGFVSQEQIVSSASLASGSSDPGGNANPLVLQPSPAPAVLDILSPAPGATIDLGPCCNADIEVRGVVSLPPRDNLYMDLVIAIDLSGSIDAKGAFADQLNAARALVHKLDPATTRVSLMGFASNAEIALPLTANKQAVFDALDTMESAGPKMLGEAGAASHFATAIHAAVTELRSGGKTYKSSDTGKPVIVHPLKIAVLLTDGIPTLPSKPGTTQDKADIHATLAAARHAAAQGVEIHGFAFAVDQSEKTLTTLPALAAITQGQYHAVDDPSAVALKLPGANFVGMGAVSVTNTSTGQSVSVQPTPDGFFSATVTIEKGLQSLEIVAFDGSGTLGTTALLEVTGQDNIGTGEPVALAGAPVSQEGLTSPLGRDLTDGGLYKLLASEFPDAFSSAAGSVFSAQGAPGVTVSVTGEIVFTDACYKSDVGFLALSPGQDLKQALAAATNKNVLINSGNFVRCAPYLLKPAQARFSFDVPTGSSVVFFMVPDSTLAKAQAGKAEVLFTMPEGNPGGYAQTMALHSPAGRRGVGGGASIIAFEDISVVTQRSDQDFDDLVLFVDDLVPSQRVCGCE